MNWELIHKYLSGECSEQELARVQQWLEESRENREQMRAMKKIWMVRPDEPNAKNAWLKFKSRVIHSGSSPIPKEDVALPFLTTKRHVKATRWYQRSGVWSAAAAMIILIMAALFLFSQQSAVPEQQYQEIVAQKGERTSMKLSDGTRVTLNSASTLRIPVDFADNTRSIYLVGEAFFEVAHNPDKPFRVHSGEAVTEVLGTKFNVNAYPDESSVEVAVLEGKVALGNGNAHNNSLHLTRHMLGVLNPDGELTVKDIADVDVYMGWKDGKLVFREASLSDVIKQLERRYNLNIAVADSVIMDRRLTALFTKEPISEILQVSSAAMKIEYTREGQNITFSSNATTTRSR